MTPHCVDPCAGPCGGRPPPYVEVEKTSGVRSPFGVLLGGQAKQEKKFDGGGMMGKITCSCAGFPFVVFGVFSPIVGGEGGGRKLPGWPKGSTPATASFIPGNSKLVNDYHKAASMIFRRCGWSYLCLRQYEILMKAGVFRSG